MQRSSSAAPFFLRLSLGLIFLWAGLGKVMATFPATGDAAAQLARLGVISPPMYTAAPENTPTEHKVEPGGASPPAAQPPAAPAVFEQKVLRVYGLSVLIVRAAHPAVNADGKKPRPIWPAFLAKGRMPVYLAWACAIAEIGAGLLVLTGLCTRLSAFVLACVMMTAMWLTEIGPAWVSGGFNPPRETFDVEAWRPALFQFVLLCAALSLTVLGSGSLGFDRVLFPPNAEGKKA